MYIIHCVCTLNKLPKILFPRISGTLCEVPRIFVCKFLGVNPYTCEFSLESTTEVNVGKHGKMIKRAYHVYMCLCVYIRMCFISNIKTPYN